MICQVYYFDPIPSFISRQNDGDHSRTKYVHIPGWGQIDKLKTPPPAGVNVIKGAVHITAQRGFVEFALQVIMNSCTYKCIIYLIIVCITYTVGLQFVMLLNFIFDILIYAFYNIMYTYHHQYFVSTDRVIYCLAAATVIFFLKA